MEFLWTMGELNIYGEDIAIGYEDCCGQDRDWFVACVLTRDEAFVRQLEKHKVAKAAATLNIYLNPLK